jgi:hypothetical protein
LANAENERARSALLLRDKLQAVIESGLAYSPAIVVRDTDR